MARTILLLLTTFLLAATAHATLDCVTPSCTTDSDRATLWPFGDANFFLRCEAESLVRRPCTNRQLFHFGRQECVDPSEWEEPCEDTELPECPRIACRGPADQRFLWPSSDPRYFLRCVPGSSGGLDEVVVACEGDALFSWIRQGCLAADEWRLECVFGDEGGTTTTEPSRGICPEPYCQFQDDTLYPHSDWTMYYQCIPDVSGWWVPLARPCADNTFFHFGDQRCVFMFEWEDFCLD